MSCVACMGPAPASGASSSGARGHLSSHSSRIGRRAHARIAILVLGLIHGETLPRRRSVAFLLRIPVPLLAYLAPIEGWTAATAYEGNVLGGFLVVCLGIALAETVYARYSSRLLAAHSFWLGVGIIALIVAGPVYAYG